MYMHMCIFAGKINIGNTICDAHTHIHIWYTPKFIRIRANARRAENPKHVEEINL